MTEEKFEGLRICQGNIYMLKNLISQDGKINEHFINQLMSNSNEFYNDFVTLRDKYLAKYTKLFKEA